MWLFPNILYVTVWSFIKLYVILFLHFIFVECFNTQNTSLVTAVLINAVTAPGTASHRQRARSTSFTSILERTG